MLSDLTGFKHTNLHLVTIRDNSWSFTIVAWKTEHLYLFLAPWKLQHRHVTWVWIKVWPSQGIWFVKEQQKDPGGIKGNFQQRKQSWAVWQKWSVVAKPMWSEDDPTKCPALLPDQDDLGWGLSRIFNCLASLESCPFSSLIFHASYLFCVVPNNFSASFFFKLSRCNSHVF